MAVGLQLQPTPPFPREIHLLLCSSLHVHFQALVTSEIKLRFCIQLIFVLLLKGNKNIFKETLAHLKVHKEISWLGKFTQEWTGLKINYIF